MHIYVRRGLEVALVVGGGILFFAGQASADEGTSGADSALGGNQAAVSVVGTDALTTSSKPPSPSVYDDTALALTAPPKASETMRTPC